MPTITLAQRRYELDQHIARTMLRIAHETATDDTPIRTTTGATLAGDERRLRGIPAIARGVPGAIPGTRP